MAVDLEKLPGALIESDGFPRPQWEVIYAWVTENLDPSDHESFWREAAIAWLTGVCESIGDEAMIHASREMLLVSTRPSDRGGELLRFALKMLRRIEKLLGDPAADDAEGPCVVIVLADHERFYDYISYFHPDGEFGGAAGMCVRQGYQHTVVGPGDFAERRRSIAHELTHEVLTARELPLWFEEGITQLMEEEALGYPLVHMDRELLRRHREHWGREGLDAFWSGEGFSMPGEMQELSYHLAQVMLRNIVADGRKRLKKFVAQASCADCGEAAARAELKRSLADYATMFLGPGDWAPPE